MLTKTILPKPKRSFTAIKHFYKKRRLANAIAVFYSNFGDVGCTIWEREEGDTAGRTPPPGSMGVQCPFLRPVSSQQLAAARLKITSAHPPMQPNCTKNREKLNFSSG